MAKNPLSTILDSNRLVGPNYADWYRNLKIVLQSERKDSVLDAPLPRVTRTSTDDEHATFDKWTDDNIQVRCIMMASMTNELQKQFEHVTISKDIIKSLEELYGTRTRRERFAISKELFQAHSHEGSSVHHPCFLDLF